MTYEPSERDARLVTVRTKACIQCGGHSQIEMPLGKYRQWMDGESLQDVMPEWSAERQELLLSGTHADCWKEIFAGMDEGDDYPEEDE